MLVHTLGRGRLAHGTNEGRGGPSNLGKNKQLTPNANTVQTERLWLGRKGAVVSAQALKPPSL